jgi:hypothetical protein
MTSKGIKVGYIPVEETIEMTGSRFVVTGYLGELVYIMTDEEDIQEQDSLFSESN